MPRPSPRGARFTDATWSLQSNRLRKSRHTSENSRAEAVPRRHIVGTWYQAKALGNGNFAHRISNHIASEPVKCGNPTMFQIQRSAPVADVVIIGSGAGGGTTTKVLVKAQGPASPSLEPILCCIRRPISKRDHKSPYHYSHRGREGGASYFGHGRDFGWFSAHAAGGSFRVSRVHRCRGFPVPLVPVAHCGRAHQSLRSDFSALCRLRSEPFTRDGWARTGRSDYDEIAVLRQGREFIGVTGSREGIGSAPDGVSTVSSAARHVRSIQKASQKLGIP